MIKLKIKDKTYTIQEAKELYNELKGLFGEATPVLPYYPPGNVPYPNNLPNPYYTVSTTGAGDWFELEGTELTRNVQ